MNDLSSQTILMFDCYSDLQPGDLYVVRPNDPTEKISGQPFLNLVIEKTLHQSDGHIVCKIKELCNDTNINMYSVAQTTHTQKSNFMFNRWHLIVYRNKRTKT